MESKNLYADEMPIEESGISDLDLNMFREFYDRRIGESFDDITLPVNKIMHNLKLLSDGKCTMAGLLLFGKNPQEDTNSAFFFYCKYLAEPVSSRLKSVLVCC